jgi:hypothetical protein
MLMDVCNEHGIEGMRKGSGTAKSHWICIKCQQRKNNIAREIRKKELRTARLSTGCEWPGCSVNDRDMLQFDHIPSRGYRYKKISSNMPLGKLRRELELVKVICGNHHAKITKMRERGETNGESIIYDR